MSFLRRAARSDCMDCAVVCAPFRRRFYLLEMLLMQHEISSFADGCAPPPLALEDAGHGEGAESSEATRAGPCATPPRAARARGAPVPSRARGTRRAARRCAARAPRSRRAG